MKNCIVLASIASRKSLAIARSIKDLLKFRVIGIAHNIHPNIFSIFFDKAYIVRVDRNSLSWIYSVLNIAKEHKCIAVVPIDFIDFYMFSKYQKVFGDHNIILVSPPYESIVAASNRIVVFQTIGDIVHVPNQVSINSSNDITKIYNLIPPLVVKNISDASSPSFHLDYSSAISEAINRMPVIIQEYVEGIARGYYALVANGIPILEFVHQRLIEYTPIGGASLAAEGFVKDPILINIGRKIVERLKWSGVIMVETRYSDEKGKYYVIELNPKFWGSIDLPESLGYKFSALVIALYIYGIDYTLKLKEDLGIRNGSFVWLLDATRYLPKLPWIWFDLFKKTIKNPLLSDVKLNDPAINVVQIIKAIQKFSYERTMWKNYLINSMVQNKFWIYRFLKFVSSAKKAIVLDFDATIVKLPINWGKLRRKLVEEGLLYPWESINRAFTRLWYTNLEQYYKLSDKVEEYELNSLNNIKLLASSNLLKELRKHSLLCIATKQTTSVVSKALSRLGLYDTIDTIIGRDSGFGPIKTTLYKKCINVNNNISVIVIDDNLEYLVDAYRIGYTPMLAVHNLYTLARSYRLGIPASDINSIIKLIIRGIKLRQTI